MHAYIAPGYRCNHECVCCPLSTFDRLHGDVKPAALFAKTQRLIDEASEKNEPLFVTISGGEPFLYDETPELIARLSRAGARITVLSNAARCRDEALIARLCSALAVPGRERAERLCVTTAIHAADPAVHDAVTGRAGSLIETLEGLDALHEMGAALTVKIILHRVAAERLCETLDYLDEHFAPNVRVQLCGADFCGRAAKHRKELEVPLRELSPMLEGALDHWAALQSSKNRAPRHLSIIEAPLCLADPVYWPYFQPAANNGAAYVAPNDETGEETGTSDLQCGTFYEECGACAAKHWCQGCWRSVYRPGTLNPVHETI